MKIEKSNVFAFCYSCGKRTNIESDHGFVWGRHEGKARRSQCQKCGDELTQKSAEFKAMLEDLEKQGS